MPVTLEIINENEVELTVETSPIGAGGGDGLQLGNTSTTAFRGDWGQLAYDHSQITSGNPHGTTKSDLGLGNVDNTADTAKPISTVTQTALNAKADLVGGKVPANQLPGFVDDVEEYANLAAFPVAGESGKLYIAINTNLVYRWTGSVYAVTSSSLALGNTSTTAFRGDWGQTAYDHSQITSGNPHGTTKSDLGLGNVDNTADADKPLSAPVETHLDTNFAKLNNDEQDIIAHELSINSLAIRNATDTAATALTFDAAVLFSSERLTLDSSFQLQSSNFEDNAICLLFGWQPLFPNVFCGAGAGSWNDGANDWNKGTLSFICNEDSGTLGSKTILIDGETGITVNAGTGLLQLTYQTVAVSNALAFATAIGLGSTSSPAFTGLSVTGTGTLRLPSGTTGQRVDTQGIRYNSTTGRHEFYTGSTWYNHARLTGDTFTGAVGISVNGALSAPAFTGTGTWVSGGTATTTKPAWLLEPTGATSSAWSTAGTGFGINSAAGFTGNQLDVQANGSSLFRINGNSNLLTCTLDTLDLTSSFGTTRAKYYHSRSGIGAYIQTVFGASNEWVLVGSDAVKVPFAVRGATGQTANLFTASVAAGSVLFAINKDGIPIIPTSTPASASATGTTGMIAWDSSYLYVCTASNTWRRVLHETW